MHIFGLCPLGKVASRAAFETLCPLGVSTSAQTSQAAGGAVDWLFMQDLCIWNIYLGGRRPSFTVGLSLR